MEKVYFTGGIKTLNDPVWGVLRLLQDKENEIVDWINGYEKYVEPLEKAWKQAVEETLEQAKEWSSGNHSMALPKGSRSHNHSKVLRYKLSNDSIGLVAYLAGGISYHIHSNELTPEQKSIKIQLLGMEGA